MNKKEAKSLYDVARRNEHIVTLEGLAEHTGVELDKLLKVVRQYSYIRVTLKENAIKSGAGMFGRFLRLMPATSGGWERVKA